MLHRDSNIILPETFDLLVELQAEDRLKEFFLVGGTALALRLGHRLSIEMIFLPIGILMQLSSMIIWLMFLV